MSKRSLLASFTLAALASVATASAETHKFEVDPKHSEVGFTVRHLVAKVPGRFGEFEGTVSMDPNAIESTLQIHGKVTTASIDTGVKNRDDHLRSADFFNVEKFPEITFASKKAAKAGEGYAVTGDFTMLGVTKEVTLNAEVLGVVENPFSKTPSAGLELTGKVNRKDFGMVWNKTLDAGGVMLGDDVDLTIRLEANVPAPEKAAK